MKVKLLETVQGAGISGVLLHEGITVTILEPGELYDVDPSLGVWLIENRKAEAVEETPHYGAQTEPELRHDDELADEITAEVEPESDMMTTDNQATRKKGKRK